MPIGFDISGIQEAQEKNLKMIAATTPSGALGQGVKIAAVALHRYAVQVTHVHSGALKASHRIEISKGRARIYIDPTSVNPSGMKPSEYGVVEQNRGGSHAFYKRTAREAGPSVIKQVVEYLRRHFRRS